jgi:hypothetical protein
MPQQQHSHSMLSEASYHNMTVGRIPSVEGGIQPTIVDAKGDLIVATGNDSPNRLAVGANNLVLTADSAEATGLKWAAPDPLTTKGDLFTYSTTEDRLGVGANDTVLTADSSTATGLKWATPAAGGMTLLSTTTLSGATTTISGISGSYTDLKVVIFGVTNATASGLFRCAPNGTTNICDFVNNSTTTTLAAVSDNYLRFSGLGTNGSLLTDTTNSWNLDIINYASTTARKPVEVYGSYLNDTGARRGYFAFGGINTASAITSLVFSNDGGNLSGGTVLIYGVK